MKKIEVRKITDDKYLMKKGDEIKHPYSVFSSLDFLNRSVDLYKNTKNTISTALKMIYSADELKLIMQKASVSSFNDLCNKIINKSEKSTTIADLRTAIKNFQNSLKQDPTLSTNKNLGDKDTYSKVGKYEDSPRTLVKQATCAFGDNRYFVQNYNKDDFNKKLMPLFVAYASTSEGLESRSKIENYIKDVYGYSFQVSSNKNLLQNYNKVINIQSSNNQLETSINMLYNVAKNFVGTKNINIFKAKALINKEEFNEFLSSSETNIIQKWQIFNHYKDDISDVIATLTTIFMARFCFDNKYFSEIEKDLTEQAMFKMQNLVITKDPEEDYWINQLIQERLKLNIAQVLTANNITNAEQLINIYNNNGTTIQNVSEINSIDDLVFSVQYSGKEKVKNKKPDNVYEPEISKGIKSNVKNKEEKVKKPKSFFKETEYVKNIRTTEAYKKYYEEWMFKLNGYEEALKSEENAKINEIVEKANENLLNLDEVAHKPSLTEEQKEKIFEGVAKNDAVIEICENAKENKELKQENKQQEEQENPANQETNTEVKSEDEKIVSEQEKDSLNETILEEDDTINKKANPPKVIYLGGKISNKEEVTQETSNQEINKEDDIEKKVVFGTSKNIGELSDKEIEAKSTKYLTQLIYGKNGKPGIIGEMLNYRVINKEGKNDSNIERLDDKDFRKFNKVRDNEIEKTINAISEDICKFYKENTDTIDKDIKFEKLVMLYFKHQFNMNPEENLNKTGLKNRLSVLITKKVNERLKEFNVELYTGKKSFKKYVNEINNLEETINGK